MKYEAMNWLKQTVMPGWFLDAQTRFLHNLKGRVKTIYLKNYSDATLASFTGGEKFLLESGGRIVASYYYHDAADLVRAKYEYFDYTRSKNLKHEILDKDGSVYYYSHSKYNSDGVLIEEREWRKDQEEKIKAQVVAESGRTIVVDVTWGRKTYENGRLIEYMSNGGGAHNVFKYDPLGNLQEEQYYENGTLRYCKKFDQQERLVYHRMNSIKGSEIVDYSLSLYTYGENVLKTRADRSGIYNYTYTESNSVLNIVEERSGSMTSECRYNDAGDLVYSNSRKEIFKYEDYKYDAVGNWVSRTTIHKKKVWKHEEREIEYF